MTRIALFAGGDLQDFETDFDYFIGVDRGSLFLLENGLPLDMAIGDFDSVTVEEFKQITTAAKEVIQAPAAKNDTDTELALKTILTRFPQAQLSLFGAFGGRLDHFMSNLFLPSDPALAPFMRQIRLLDYQNLIEFYPSGTQSVEMVEGMTYVSFMADGDADLTIEGAKYELSATNFFKKKIYSSNEFTNKSIEVTLEHGYLIVIHSRDRS